MSVLPITEAAVPVACCDLEAHLPPREFPTSPDPALRGRCLVTPADVHIRRKEAA